MAAKRLPTIMALDRGRCPLCRALAPVDVQGKPQKHWCAGQMVFMLNDHIMLNVGDFLVDEDFGKPLPPRYLEGT